MTSSLFEAEGLLGLGFGNVFAEAGFRGPSDFSLLDGSAAVDAGDRFLDFDPLSPGFQGAPEVDLAGKPRVRDGNGDGSEDIDMGAYEFQPGSGQIDATGN